MTSDLLSRRQVLTAAAAAATAVGLGRVARARAAAAPWRTSLDFTALPDRPGWPGWRCPGVANLRVQDGRGVLEAASDVFPCDPRPVAFGLDRRTIDQTVEVAFDAVGAGAGAVVRRTAPRAYYAAVLDAEQQALVLLRRHAAGAEELARAPVVVGTGPLAVSLSARGSEPTRLVATAGAARVTATDDDPALQAAGDPGVLATSRTLFPSEGPPVLPALGNLHLLPYGVQEGQAFLASPAGAPVLESIRERSTALVRSIVVSGTGAWTPTLPTVVAAGAGLPLLRGLSLRVATDVPARVEVELARDARFTEGRRVVRAGITGTHDAVLPDVHGLPAGEVVHWRPRVRRRGRTVVGPARRARVLPAPGDPAEVTLAIGSCAAQFGPVFDRIAERDPDVLVWQGDLNYPDTLGPLAQTTPAYAGIWRDFLANPLMRPILDRTAFVAQRDDHDYGLQDSNSTNLVPFGLGPWEALVERRTWMRFHAGLADVWVLDQRKHKSDPALPDTPEKTLLGAEQRAWLLRTLAASTAPFKVVCSPCTLAPVAANARDGSWAAGFTAERDLLLAHVAERVSGRTIFVTGDTHWTMAYDRDGLFEARPCPMGIPTPNDITIVTPQAAEDARQVPGVVFADDDRGHVGLLTVRGEGGRARLDLELVREDGAVPYRRRFEQPLPRRR